MKTFLMDFDGVIHDHSTNEWLGVSTIQGKPILGIKETIEKLRTKYKIVVYSSRCLYPGGAEAIQQWLSENNIIVDGITKDKLSYASIIIDDRAVNFSGDCDKLISDIDELLERKVADKNKSLNG